MTKTMKINMDNVKTALEWYDIGIKITELVSTIKPGDKVNIKYTGDFFAMRERHIKDWELNKNKAPVESDFKMSKPINIELVDAEVENGTSK